MPPTAGVDQAEIAKFEAMAGEWWDPDGKFKPLHMMTPCRLGYAVAQIAAQHGRRVSGFGCGRLGSHRLLALCHGSARIQAGDAPGV